MAPATRCQMPFLVRHQQLNWFWGFNAARNAKIFGIGGNCDNRCMIHSFPVINTYLRKSLSEDWILNFLLSSQFSNGNNFWFRFQSIHCQQLFITELWIFNININPIYWEQSNVMSDTEHACACHFVQLLILWKIIDAARTHGFFCALWKQSFPTI